MDNYILIGVPGSGKSTLGRRAAEILGLGFYDTDVISNERALARRRFVPMSAASAEAFAEEEKKVVAELGETARRLIIATGAGTPLYASNASILKRLGTLIYITRDPDIIIADIRENKRYTLVLENKRTHETFNMRELALGQFVEFRSYYEGLADIVLDNDGDEDAGVEKLVEIIKKRESQRESSGLKT